MPRGEISNNHARWHTYLFLSKYPELEVRMTTPLVLLRPILFFLFAYQFIVFFGNGAKHVGIALCVRNYALASARTHLGLVDFERGFDRQIN